MKNVTKKILVLANLLITMIGTSQAANFYWVGGTGNWSDYANHWATTSGGNIFQSSIPTINDDVVFDSQSFNTSGQSLHLDSTFYFCRNMSWTGVQNNPILEGAGAVLTIFGSLMLDPNMTVNQTGLTFASALTGNTIDTKGIEFGLVRFTGVGTYTLNSAMNSMGSVLIEAGTLDANGNNIRCNNMLIDVSATFISGNITITVFGTSFSVYPRSVDVFGNVINSTLTNIYFDCVNGQVDATGTVTHFDTITFTGAGTLKQMEANYATFVEHSFAENSTIHHATFSKEVWLTSCVFDTLEGIDIRLQLNTTTTINNTIILNSDCNRIGNISIITPGGGGTATLSAASGNIILDYVTLDGIVATGGATFIANHVIDNGGNVGWTISNLAPRSLFWIGGTGNWNDPAHWSLSSGGASASCGPTKLDSVFFDVNSLLTGDTVYTATVLATAHTISVSNIPSQCVFSGEKLTIIGSINIQSSLSWRISTLLLLSASPVATISSISPFYDIEMQGSGTYTANSDLTFNILYHEIGTMDFSHRNIHALLVTSYPITTVIMDSTHFYVKQYDHNGTQLFSETAQITFDQTLGHMYSEGNFGSIEFLQDGTLDSNVTASVFTNFGPVHIGTNNSLFYMDVRNDLFIHGDNLTDTLNLNNAGYSLIQDAGKTLTVVDNIFSTSDCNHFITLRSAISGQQTNIVKTNSNPVSVDHVELADINSSGATFNANNSTNSGNNSGWSIQSSVSRIVYWVGGSGNWTDPTHWSLTSGGTGGNCMPTSVDDVFIDSNSGLSGGTLTIDISNASVNLLNMSSAGINCTLTGTNLSAYWSVYFASGMNVNLDHLSMRSLTACELQSSGCFLSEVDVNSTGLISLAGDLACKSVHVIRGSFNMNGYNIAASNVSSNPGAFFNSGDVTIDVTNFQLEGTNTNTELTNINLKLFPPAYYVYGGNFKTAGTFKDISVQYAGSDFSNLNFNCRNFVANYFVDLNGLGGGDTIQKATFYSDASLSGTIYFDTLFLNNPGNTMTLSGNQNIGSQLICNSSPGFPIFLNGNLSSTITKSGTDVCLNYVILKGITASGGANFYAGQGCTDLGSNVNWQFLNCTNVTDVWPGDANYDLDCNNFDILNIGVAFNQTGPVRIGGNNSWTAQPAADYGSWFNSAINLKHADCDGNGVVDYADTLAVSQNYNLTHPARYANPQVIISSVLPALVLDATPDTVGPSMAVQINVLLGTTLLPVDSLYGIAFSINYDPTIIDTTSVQANFAGSWLGTQGTDMITFVHHTPSIGKIDVAMVRNDQQNILNGSGHLADFDVVIVDNISTITNSLFSVTDVSAITYSQYVQSIARINDTILVDPLFDRINPIDPSTNFSIYPNPTSSIINVSAKDVQVESVAVYDVTGRRLIQKVVSNNQITISVEKFTQGVYQLRLYTNKGVFNRTIEVLSK